MRFIFREQFSCREIWVAMLRRAKRTSTRTWTGQKLWLWGPAVGRGMGWNYEVKLVLNVKCESHNFTRKIWANNSSVLWTLKVRSNPGKVSQYNLKCPPHVLKITGISVCNLLWYYQFPLPNLENYTFVQVSGQNPSFCVLLEGQEMALLLEPEMVSFIKILFKNKYKHTLES